MLGFLNYGAFHLIPFLLNVANGCFYIGIIMFKTFEHCYVWASSMATDCAVNSHYWKGGNVYDSNVFLCMYGSVTNILKIVGNSFADNYVCRQGMGCFSE